MVWGLGHERVFFGSSLQESTSTRGGVNGGDGVGRQKWVFSRINQQLEG